MTRYLLECHHRPEWTIWLGEWHDGLIDRLAIAIFSHDIYWAFPATTWSDRCPVSSTQEGDFIVYFSRKNQFHAFYFDGRFWRCRDNALAFKEMSMPDFITFVLSLRPTDVSSIVYVKDKLGSQPDPR